MISSWPEYTEEWNYPEDEAAIDHAKDLVKGIRTIRKDMDVPPSRKAKIIITSDNADIRKIFGDVKDAYTGLAGASEIQIQEGTEGVPADAVSVVIPDAVLYVPLEDLVDFEKEKERLTNEKEKL